MSVLAPACFDCPAEVNLTPIVEALRGVGVELAVYTNDATHLREMERQRVQVGGPIPVLFDRGDRREPEHERTWQRAQVLGPVSKGQATVALLETCDRYHSPSMRHALEFTLDAYTMEHIEAAWMLGGEPAIVTLVSDAVKRHLCSGGDVPGVMIMRH